MRWFTDAAYRDDHSWDTAIREYRRHLEALMPSLPPALSALAFEPRLNLHDAEIRQMEVNVPDRHVTIVARTGHLQVGYRNVTIRFSEASVEPDNLQALAYAIGARYRTDHWGEAVTVVREQEVDRLDDGHYVLRLRLWPFHAFAVVFGALDLAEAASGPRTREPGIFKHVQRGEPGAPR